MKKIQVNQLPNLLSELGNIMVFHYLTDGERQDLLDICEGFVFDKGEKIITQGDISSSFYAVISGNVNITVIDEDNKESALGSIGKGDFFGEAGIFTNGQRTATVSCSSNTLEVLCLDREKFLEFIKRSPMAGVKILMLFVGNLLKKLNEANKELATAKSSVLDKSELDQFLKNLY